jgi:hypothetical protein
MKAIAWKIRTRIWAQGQLPFPYNLQVRRHVEEVMKVVELDVLRDSLVGVPGESGLSVEARKRLSIAVEQASSTSCTAVEHCSLGH